MKIIKNKDERGGMRQATNDEDATLWTDYRSQATNFIYNTIDCTNNSI